MGASSSVVRVRLVVSAPTPKVAETGSAPLSIEPVSATLTLTVSSAVNGPLRVSVNVASAPSVTGLGPGSIDTSATKVGMISGAAGASVNCVPSAVQMPPSAHA